MKIILISLNILSLLAAIVWLYFDRDFEPLITLIGLICSLLVLIYTTSNENKSTFTQRGGKNSKNYQSGNDINIQK